MSPDNHCQFIEDANTAIIKMSKCTKFLSVIFHSKTSDILTSLQQQEFHVDFDVNLDNVECIIRTDGGKEFTAHEFNKTVNKHRYFQ